MEVVEPLIVWKPMSQWCIYTHIILYGHVHLKYSLDDFGDETVLWTSTFIFHVPDTSRATFKARHFCWHSFSKATITRATTIHRQVAYCRCWPRMNVVATSLLLYLHETARGVLMWCWHWPVNTEHWWISLVSFFVLPFEDVGILTWIMECSPQFFHLVSAKWGVNPLETRVLVSSLRKTTMEIEHMGLQNWNIAVSWSVFCCGSGSAFPRMTNFLIDVCDVCVIYRSCRHRCFWYSNGILYSW